MSGELPEVVLGLRLRELRGTLALPCHAHATLVERNIAHIPLLGADIEHEKEHDWSSTYLTTMRVTLSDVSPARISRAAYAEKITDNATSTLSSPMIATT